ncbi:hypothetical protein [Bythopirellula polymerisocia]|uniref:PEP-CTERM protein-sorting domain-containing protein n=1 Tax=Bythopirellula polymerisocia TaxID=2528003 RepID=A0A5C6CXT6_9BACT|nr:hypothetical protein [Bythopirellula polymerisocia]TWU28374.1 hypothetical protein Pla144_16620 [Bythopirellula polymerisocia]
MKIVSHCLALLLCLVAPVHAVVVFQDTFSGPAGPLTAHVPDVNDAGGTWTFSDGSLTQPQQDIVWTIDGNGNMYNDFVITTVFIDIEPGDITDKIVTLTFTIDIVDNPGLFLIGFGNDDFRGIDQRSVGPVVGVESSATLKMWNPGGLSDVAFEENPVLNQVNDFSTVSVAFNTSDNSFEITGDHDDPAFQQFSGAIDPSNIYALFEDPGPSGVLEFDYLYIQSNSASYPLLSEIIVDVSDIPEGQAGDFDMDGDVDGHDFLTWQRDPGVGSLSDWQNNYGSPQIAPVLVGVPEPTAHLLLLIGVVGMAQGGSLVRRH